MSSYRLIPGLLVTLSAAHAEERPHKNIHVHEEIVVTAPFRQNAADTALPINILSGETLDRAISNSLGSTLKGEAGIHSSSFGTGVGKAVIRGQSGNRVQVMENNLAVIDVAAVSPDHADGVEPLLAERIEVLRGPSTLLYGNGAIGGVINVIDNKIPEYTYEQPALSIEQAHNTVSDENKTVFKAGASAGTASFYIDGFRRNNNDVAIEGYAINDADSEDPENTRGFIANSDGGADGGTLGFSVSGQSGYIGLSVTRLTSDYGLPPSSHGAHHEDDHEEDHHDGDVHEEADHEEEEAFIRLNMKQKRYNLRAAYTADSTLLDQVSLRLSRTDYQHREIEVESGEAFIGTTFINDGIEGRATLTHHPINNWRGILGIQFGESEFSATGEEAFIPETDRSYQAMFLVERLENGRATWELGARVERTDLNPSQTCDSGETTISASGSLIYDLSESRNLLVSLSRSERAPTIEERYSNIVPATCIVHDDPENLVLHAATGLIETGNPDLDVEAASNIEIGYRDTWSEWDVEINAFYNRIQDYIYLADTFIEFEEQPVFSFQAEDAVFKGIETTISRKLAYTGLGELDLTLKADLVRASFKQGGDVPRIPPARLGLNVDYHNGPWTVGFGIQKIFKQSQTAYGEDSTDGYTGIDLYADYHLLVAGGELTFFVSGENLLDEDIRNHVSFLKNSAPEPGRGARFGLRYIY
jgi:iron complex outermembrane receptor protein